MGFAEAAARKPVVWIIEDYGSKTGAHRVGGHVKKQGCEVVYFDTHDKAWAAVQEKSTQKPNMILCDGDEGKGMSGTEFIASLKKGIWREVPIVGFSSLDLVNKTLEQAGANTSINRNVLAQAIDPTFHVDVRSGANWQDGAATLGCFNALLAQAKTPSHSAGI